MFIDPDSNKERDIDGRLLVPWSGSSGAMSRLHRGRGGGVQRWSPAHAYRCKENRCTQRRDSSPDTGRQEGLISARSQLADGLEFCLKLPQTSVYQTFDILCIWI